MTSISAENNLLFDSSLFIDTSTQCDTVLGEAPGWMEEDAKKWKKEQHRTNMIAFRLKKKQKEQKLRDEHRRLEGEMKQLTTSVQDSAAKREVSGDEGVKSALQELVVERDALSKQNLALREEIIRHQELHKALVQTEGETEAPTMLPKDDKDGWRVQFPTGVPSFHFHPWTFLGWNVYRSPLTISQADGRDLVGTKDSAIELARW
ncbi:hypothetical protein BBJ29_003859 [Phytophthora kernoviae]|uniref:BZIP domain-containing protein n=1 Tax=Phytophthora kernoviae TaxID=325452 RepID=A0A3F2RQF2_9STRA|nr:hypothetical protein BBP00_00005157 [Phytophthora kernoviae]RLN66620.1 hypothetical protein BBJ29_003859 [Phytophthora kernoviae]